MVPASSAASKYFVTTRTHTRTTPPRMAPLGLVLVPLFFGLLLYMALVAATWPYARRAPMPLGLLLLALFLPPLFPALLVYVFCVATLAPREPDVVVVVAPAAAVPRGAAVAGERRAVARV